MNAISVREASKKWNISERRITRLCASGRISGAEKKAGVWLLPSNAEKPVDARKKSGAYVGWRKQKNTIVKERDFEEDLRCVKATLAIEGLTVSKEGLGNLKRIQEKKASSKQVIEELKRKYSEV